jgi:hypothetical protein
MLKWWRAAGIVSATALFWYEMKTQRAGPFIGIACMVCLTLWFIAFTSDRVWATTPIYKCFDKNLSLVYTDEPCRDGEQLDIRAGDADPAAVAWLQRERDELDQSAAQRIADQRRLGALGQLMPAFQYAPIEQFGPYEYAPYFVDSGFWSYPFVGRHPMRFRKPALHHMRYFASPLPRVVPSRPHVSPGPPRAIPQR